MSKNMAALWASSTPRSTTLASSSTDEAHQREPRRCQDLETRDPGPNIGHLEIETLEIELPSDFYP